MTSLTSEVAAQDSAALAGRTLEALRLGVVPDDDLSACTVGRDVEFGLIDDDLDETIVYGGAARVFLGDYGTGKSHLLELVTRRASTRGFLTARVVLDAKETPPSHPQRVFRALMRDLHYPDEAQARGLAPLFERAIESPKALARFGVEPRRVGDLDQRLAAGEHLYLSAALAYVRSLNERRRIVDVAPEKAEAWRDDAFNLLLDWIEGLPSLPTGEINKHLGAIRGAHPKLYSLKDYRPWARIYGYLLSGIAQLARDVGYRGLVVTIDEAEFYALLSSENRGFARGLFKALSFAARGGAEADDAELARGGAGVLRRLPGRYSDEPGLYVVFAMTPAPEGTAGLEAAISAARISTLTRLDVTAYRALAPRICAVYSEASGWPVPDRAIGALGGLVAAFLETGQIENPRQAMKFLIEFLDIARHRPDQVGALLKGLREQLSYAL